MTKTITPVNVQISEREARHLVDLINWAKANGYKGNDSDEEEMEYLGFVAGAIIDETVKNYGRGTDVSLDEKTYIKAHMRGQHGNAFYTKCPFCE